MHGDGKIGSFVTVSFTAETSCAHGDTICPALLLPVGAQDLARADAT